MTDSITEAFASLERVETPLTWADVVDRDEKPILFLDAVAGGDEQRPRRWVGALAAAAAVAVIVGLVVVVSANDDSPGVRTTAGEVGLSPMTGTPMDRVFPVTAWTGDLYLVWSGEWPSEVAVHDDGWAYDPATGETFHIPPAPIAARSEAAAVWTGEELIVCCGRGVGPLPYGTATAAAFRPGDNSWRVLADPPEAADRGFGAAVWTGDEMIVVFGDRTQEVGARPDDPAFRPAVVAYDPASDEWRELAVPPFLKRIPEAVWTGHEVVVWNSGQGYRYDPGTDTWADLPPLPEGRGMGGGSVAWTGEEIVVYGEWLEDASRAVAARWTPGDATWRPVAGTGLGPLELYEGTWGSQSLAWDRELERLVVWPLHTAGSSPPLLAWDPDTDTWERFDAGDLGYHPDLTVVDGMVLWPDPARPVAVRLDG